MRVTPLPDGPLPDVDPDADAPPIIQGRAFVHQDRLATVAKWRKIAEEKGLSLRELVIDQFERGPFVGTPQQVADALDDFVQNDGADGVVIGSHLVPVGPRRVRRPGGADAAGTRIAPRRLHRLDAARQPRPAGPRPRRAGGDRGELTPGPGRGPVGELLPIVAIALLLGVDNRFVALISLGGIAVVSVLLSAAPRLVRAGGRPARVIAVIILPTIAVAIHSPGAVRQARSG